MPPVKKPAAAVSAAGDREIDLDAARIARAESNGTPVALKLGGKKFTLPPELPADFALMAQQGQMRDAITALLGDDADAFFALRPSIDDITALAEMAGVVYGITEGEALASPAS